MKLVGIGFALILAVGATPAQAEWNCRDTATGIEPTRDTQRAIGTSEEQPPEIAVRKLERLERRVELPDDKVAVYERLGSLYFGGGRFEDALRVYSLGFDLDVASTAIRENFRAALAVVLARLRRHDEVIKLFERDDRPVCPSARASGRLALAFSYAAAQQFDKAEAITTAQLTSGEELDLARRLKFHVLHMNLACARDDAKACTQRWDGLLRFPQRDDVTTEALLEKVAQLSRWPEGQAVVAAATRDGLLLGDHLGRVPVRAKELIPLSRVLPAYPRQAAAQGIVQGTVELEIGVAADGTVESVRVVKATPAKVFDTAAIAAVRQWLFKPPMVAGKPVPTVGNQVVEFRIEHAE